MRVIVWKSVCLHSSRWTTDQANTRFEFAVYQVIVGELGDIHRNTSLKGHDAADFFSGLLPPG